MTLQFLQHYAQDQAGATVTPNYRKRTNEGSVPKTQRKKGKGKGQSKNSVNEVTTPTESATTPPVGTSASQISRITQDGDIWHRPVPWMEMKMRIMKWNTSWLRSGTEDHSANPKTGTLCTCRWTSVRMSTCALHIRMHQEGVRSDTDSLVVWPHTTL